MRRALAAVAGAAALTGVPASAGAVVSQGAFRLGADAVWTLGLPFDTGDVVAVVDEGFGGLDASIAAGELPAREVMVIRSFDTRFGLGGRDRMDRPTEHGTRMAEIIHDVAPDARLVLVNYNTVAEFASAAAWVAQQGIPVVSHSNSFLDGPFDGSGAAAQAVDRAAAQGVLWVNSAGNFAQRHWSGRGSAEGTVIAVPATPGGWLDLHLSWRDALARGEMTAQRRQADGTWVVVATGSTSGPVSVALGPLQMDDAQWRIVVRQTAGAPQDMELFSGSQVLGAAAVPGGSVATPGDAAGSLTVAAVPWASGSAAPYSSRGPTDDGRAKPDISGPTYVTANPAFPGTAGTSAATAHVAGAALLLRQARRAAGLPVSPGDLRAALSTSALDLGDPGTDPVYGAGMARLDVTPPRLAVRAVRSPATLLVRATDDGTLDAIEVRNGGRLVRRVRRASLALRLSARDRGRPLTVRVLDLAGNIAERRIRVAAR